MGAQLNMLDMMRPAPVRLPVDPNGPVTPKAQEELMLMVDGGTRIQLHQHTDGMWMWGTSFQLKNCTGGGYQVGPKWGRFAQTREDALYHAAQELRDRIAHEPAPLCRAILAWLDRIA